MAIINSTLIKKAKAEEFDMIHTLTFEEANGTCNIRLFRAASTSQVGPVYYREGTSGEWNNIYVSGTTTKIPVTSTTMQVAHYFYQDPDSYACNTISFMGQSSNLVGISVVINKELTKVGNYFMNSYAQGCSNLTSLSVPDISKLTKVGNYFMNSYAQGCSNLTSLSVPDTSKITEVGSYFMNSYAEGCITLESIVMPRGSLIQQANPGHLRRFAYGCTNLVSVNFPDNFESLTKARGENDGRSMFMGECFMGCSSLEKISIPSFPLLQELTTGYNDPRFMQSFLNGCSSLKEAEIPNIPLLEGSLAICVNYFKDCTSLEKIILKDPNYFYQNNTPWSVPSSVSGNLKGYVLNPDDLTDWKYLASANNRTLYTNYIRDPDDVVLLNP